MEPLPLFQCSRCDKFMPRKQLICQPYCRHRFCQPCLVELQDSVIKYEVDYEICLIPQCQQEIEFVHLDPGSLRGRFIYLDYDRISTKKRQKKCYDAKKLLKNQEAPKKSPKNPKELRQSQRELIRQQIRRQMTEDFQLQIRTLTETAMHWKKTCFMFKKILQVLVVKEEDYEFAGDYSVSPSKTSIKFAGQDSSLQFDDVIEEKASIGARLSSLALDLIPQWCIFLYFGYSNSGKSFSVHQTIQATCQKVLGMVGWLNLSSVEVYQEKLNDLIQGESIKKYSESASLQLESMEQLDQCLEQINTRKKTSNNNINESSSRSHAVYEISFETEGQVKRIAIADLAGRQRLQDQNLCEKVKIQARDINSSLTLLTKALKKIRNNVETFSDNSRLLTVLLPMLQDQARKIVIIPTVSLHESRMKESRQSILQICDV